MKYKTLSLCGFLICAVVLSGCWDLQEVDRRGFATTIGIDANEQGTTSLTIQMPLPQRMLPTSTPGKSVQGKQFSTTRITARTANEALNILQTKTYLELVLDQNKSIVISRNAAVRGVEPLLEFYIRNPKAPPQSLIFIARRHTAQEVLSMTPIQETLPGLQFISSGQTVVKSDRAYFISVGQFMTKTFHLSTDAYAPLIDLDQEEGLYVIAGLATFDGFHMAGELNMEETQMFGLLAGLMNAGNMTLNLPKQGLVTFRNIDGESSVKVKIAKDGSPFFLVKMQFHGTLSELDNEQKEIRPVDIQHLESAVQKVLAAKTSGVIRKLQSFNSDIIDFGEEYRVQHLAQWEKYPWKKVFPEVRFKVVVHATIERDGILR